MGSFVLVAAAATVFAAAQPVAAQDQGPYQARESWSDETGSNLNISVFVYRDVNRNGLYDVGDRPMSGIVVEATGNNRTERAISNRSGFANYRMSATDSKMEVTAPGPYSFRALVPNGWAVTSGNGVQPAFFKLMQGAPAGIVATPEPKPVGLAPDLAIEGQISEGESLLVVSPGGEETTIDGSGAFAIAATPGVWLLTALPQRTTRTVEVGSNPVRLAEGFFEEETGCGASKGLVTFDDLQLEGVLKVPSGYHGLSWDNFVMTHWKFYGPEGYRNNTMSGEFLAYNGSGHPVSISSEVPFDFVGGYFGASTLRAEGETLNITAWRGSEVAHTYAMPLSALGATQLLADFTCVTRVDFETSHYWQFTLDDLMIRLPEH